MLNFDKNNTELEFVVTLTEKCKLQTSAYWFVFENVTTKEKVTITKTNDDDLSSYKERCNIFAIDCTDLFDSKTKGQWTYEVWEEDIEAVAITNTNLLECGKMLLSDTSNLTKQGYEPTTTIKGYAG